MCIIMIISDDFGSNKKDKMMSKDESSMHDVTIDIVEAINKSLLFISVPQII